MCGLTGSTHNDKGHSLDGHSLKPFLLDPDTSNWSGPDSALTALYKWRTKYDPAAENYSLRSHDWRYIRYENGKEELYHTAADPHEWTNLAGEPEQDSQLSLFRKQLASRVPAPGSSIPAQPAFKPKQPAKAKTKPAAKSNNQWKDEFFSKHPAADKNRDGVLTWPEYKSHKAKLNRDNDQDKH